VLERLLRTVALCASAIVLLSWGLFALDETRAASKQTAAEVAGRTASATADPSPLQERAREAAHTRVRELVDDADDVLVAPFAGAAGSTTSHWAQRSIPMLLALLVYGFGLTFLARYAHGLGVRPARPRLGQR
jgi:hypothetical protein